MRGFAYTIFVVILMAIMIEPMVEIAIILKEKVVLGAAVTNSCLLAKSESLRYEDMINMDAVIDQDKFMNLFSSNFSEVMDASCTFISTDELTFRDNSNPSKSYTIDVEVDLRVDPLTDKTVSDIEVHVETEYVYKTKYLREADASVGGLDFMIVCDRLYTAIIEN